MTTDKDGKRPYERPTLAGTSLFGAEAMTGSCCRGGACTNTQKSTQQMTIDAGKTKPSTLS